VITRRVAAGTLKPGDTIEVWWAPRRAIIDRIEPYTGKLQEEVWPKGASILHFLDGKGMTVGHDEDETLIEPGETSCPTR
jgi:hypothetical protein